MSANDPDLTLSSWKPTQGVIRHLGDNFEIGTRYNGVGKFAVSLKQDSFQTQEVFVAFRANCAVRSPAFFLSGAATDLSAFFKSLDGVVDIGC